MRGAPTCAPHRPSSCSMVPPPACKFLGKRGANVIGSPAIRQSLLWIPAFAGMTFILFSFLAISTGLDWNQKANVRKLLSRKEYQNILKKLKALPKEINQLILFTNQKLKQ